MANLSAALRQVRRTRRRLDEPTTGNFDRYRPEYEAILAAVAELAGDPAFDELKRWMIETTKDRGTLPTPGAVRRRGLGICTDDGVTVPGDSPLRG